MQIERAFSGITTLGPGERLVIWVNGCNRRCKNCVSPELQAFDARNEQNVTEFLDSFDLNHVDGVTVSGGEPFEQAHDLLLAVRHLKKRGINDILIYSGYTYAELRAKRDPVVDEILSEIAVLIDGPYVDDLNDDSGNLKGSANQNVIFLNPSYEEKYAKYYKDDREMQEFSIGNYVLAVGIPTKDYVREFISNDTLRRLKNDRH